MSKAVEFRDSHKGQATLTLDGLIERLQKIKDKYGCGEAVVSMLMEPLINGEVHQLEEGLCEVSASESYVKGEFKGVESIHLLGRSFD